MACVTPPTCLVWLARLYFLSSAISFFPILQMSVECYDKSVHTEQYRSFPHQAWEGPLASIAQVGSMSHPSCIQTSSNEQRHVITSFKEAPDSEAWVHRLRHSGPYQYSWNLSANETDMLVKATKMTSFSGLGSHWLLLLTAFLLFNYCYRFIEQRNVLPFRFLFFTVLHKHN